MLQRWKVLGLLMSGRGGMLGGIPILENCRAEEMAHGTKAVPWLPTANVKPGNQEG
jgi:hypothetical protein